VKAFPLRRLEHVVWRNDRLACLCQRDEIGLLARTRPLTLKKAAARPKDLGYLPEI
jgi:hypothetical protein